MNKGKTIAYIRVSSIDQNRDRQVKMINEKYEIDKTYSEMISAKDRNRPQLKAMLDYVREGDTVVVHDFSRLARSTKDLLDIVEELKNKNVTLISIKESIDTSTPQGKLMITMIGAINEFERENIRERQAEGIAIAKEKGKYKKELTQIDDNFTYLYEKYVHREISKVEFAKLFGVSRPTLDKCIKRYKEKLI